MEDDIKLMPHSLSLDNRKILKLTGVADVGSFDDETLRIITQCGEIEIKGEELQVTVLNIEAGELTAEGKVNSVVYTDRPIKGNGFFSKVFK